MTDTKNDSQNTFEVVKKHLLQFSKPKNLLAWKNLGETVIYQVIVITFISTGFGIFGWVLHTLNIVRAFIQMHDMAHFSFFQSIRLNKIIGSILGIYVHFPFAAWRDGHNHHHKHFGNLDRLDLSQTILFTKKKYNQMKIPIKILIRILRQPIIFFLFSSPFVWFIGLFAVIAKRYSVLSIPFTQKCLSVIFTCIILPLFGVSRTKLLISVYVAQLFGTILFHLQHSVNIAYRQRKNKWDFTKAALQGSTFLYIPKILQPFTNGIEYHHIHHLNTNIASYNISECHYSFQKSEEGEKPANKWDDYQINKVGLMLSLKSLFNVILDQQRNILIPFSYKFW